MHPTDVAARPRALSRPGVAAVAGGTLAVAGNVVLLAVPPAVPEGMLSYPLGPAAFSVWQVLFALTQALMAYGIYGLVSDRRAGGGRYARWTGIAAVAGWSITPIGELALIPVADAAADASSVSAASSVFGLGLLIGNVGLALHGVAVLRAGRWSMPAAGLPLAIALMLLFVVTPVSFALGFASLASIAVIVLADLLVVALGVALVRADGAR